MNEFYSLHLELRYDGAAPTGQVRLDDGEPHPFSGWVGLVCAVEDLVAETPEPIRSAQ
jgi:hypothetical protein